MNRSWRRAGRRVKQITAGAIFLGLLIGASGTAFTAFSAVITRIGTTSAPAIVATSSATPTSNTLPNGLSSGTGGAKTPVMEYTNQPPVQTGTTSASIASGAPDPKDGSNSALAAAMDTGGVYVGERVQRVFGSVLKGVLNTLFINSN